MKKINDYRSNLIDVVGEDSKFTSTIKNRFSTDPVINSKTGIEVEWLKARYEGFPLVACQKGTKYAMAACRWPLPVRLRSSFLTKVINSLVALSAISYGDQKPSLSGA